MMSFKRGIEARHGCDSSSPRFHVARTREIQELAYNQFASYVPPKDNPPTIGGYEIARRKTAVVPKASARRFGGDRDDNRYLSRTSLFEHELSFARVLVFALSTQPGRKLRR